MRFQAALFVVLTSAAFAQQTGFFQTSIVCGTESRHGWAQVFGETPEGWRQFDALDSLPRESRAVAKIWRGPFGNTLVLVTIAQNNLASQTTYCFHPDGSLLAVDHQVRTGWGWAFSRAQRYEAGELRSTFSHFISLKDGSEVERPGKLKHMKENAGVLDPPAYARFADLPFAALFHPLSDAESY